MKRVLLVGALILAVLIGGTFFYLKGKRFEVVITQEQIDTALEKRFPKTKSFLFIFELTYSNPEVTLLKENDRVQVGLDVTLNARLNGEEQELGGGATVTAAIRYDEETQEFFLDDAQFERFEVQGLPKEWLDKVTVAASAAAKEYLETKPVYRLETKDAKTAAAKVLLKGIEVRDQAVHVTLGL